jgi:hypothetical protein
VGGFFSKDEILAVAYYRTHPAEAHGEGHEGGGHAGTGPAYAEAAEGEAATTNDAGAGHDEDGHASDGHGSTAHSAVAHGENDEGEVAAAITVAGNDRAEYPWLYWLPVIIAYVTPFYMMRVWWLTFMGKPRDEHVYEHAHESKLMYIPLVVLAVGTLWASYFVCRPLVNGSDPGREWGHPETLLVPTIDGSHDFALMHGPHDALKTEVGFAWVAGFVLAFLVYRNGLELPRKLAVAFWPVHATLQRKFFFDDVYNAFLVGGTRVVAGISRLFDTYIVDGLVNLAGWVTERLSVLSGLVLDARGLIHRAFEGNTDKTITFLIFLMFAGVALTGVVGMIEGTPVLKDGMPVFLAFALAAIWVMLGIDGFVNDIGTAAWRVAGWARSGQDGRIRHYVMFAAAGAVVVVLAILFWDTLFASGVTEQASALRDSHEG